MNPYIGEIRMFAGTFAPVGWLFCNGTFLNIADYEVLYQLIGTTYGGDGQVKFALPDLRGRIPIHVAAQIPLGQNGGTETVTLQSQQTAAHGHAFQATTALGGSSTPTGNLLAQSPAIAVYSTIAPSAAMGASAITASPGGSLPHDNTQPFLCVDFIIATEGIYPPPN